MSLIPFFIYSDRSKTALLLWFSVLLVNGVRFGAVSTVCLRLYVPINNFSVILGRLPELNQY